MRKAVYNVLQHDYGGFLPAPLRTTAETRALLWLCDVTHQLHPHILTTPNMPYHLAERLVARGFRGTYQQIRTAAEGRVEGVEVWIRALRGHIQDCPMPVHILASALCTPAPDVLVSILHTAVAVQ